MLEPPVQTYLNLMFTIRKRLDAIDNLQSSKIDKFTKSETAAFHGRKVIEGIAFGCLVAVDNSLKTIPRDAKGQWNAEKILARLFRKNINVFPSPSIFRLATEDERIEDNVETVVEGVPERRISPNELNDIYARLHKWLHEINPYISDNQDEFISKHEYFLWDDLSKINRFVERHFISIRGKGFFCTLRDSEDGQTKVLPLSRER